MKRFLIFAQSALKSCPQRSRDPSAWSQTVSCSWSKQQSCHSWRWLGDKMSLTRVLFPFPGDKLKTYYTRPDLMFFVTKTLLRSMIKEQLRIARLKSVRHAFPLGSMPFALSAKSWALCWCWRFAKAMSFKTKTNLLSTSTCACLLSSPFYVQASPIYLWTTSVLIKTFWVKKSCYVNVAIFTWSYLWTCVLPLRLSICLSTVQMICLLWFYRPTLPIYRPHSI